MTNIKPAKFVRKPFYIDAVQVTVENIDAVAEWCSGDVRTSTEGKYVKVRVHRPLNERQTKAYIGDWVLFAGTGYKVYTPKAFENSFQAAEAEKSDDGFPEPTVIYTEADAQAQLEA